MFLPVPCSAFSDPLYLSTVNSTMMEHPAVNYGHSLGHYFTGHSNGMSIGLSGLPTLPEHHSQQPSPPQQENHVIARHSQPTQQDAHVQSPPSVEVPMYPILLFFYIKYSIHIGSIKINCEYF